MWVIKRYWLSRRCKSRSELEFLIVRNEGAGKDCGFRSALTLHDHARIGTHDILRRFAKNVPALLRNFRHVRELIHFGKEHELGSVIDVDRDAVLGKERNPLEEPKIEALRHLVSQIVEKRGWLSDAEVQAFLARGYTKAQLLDVMVGVSMKTLSNYINHLTDPPNE